jgi:hypothetical protein
MIRRLDKSLVGKKLETNEGGYIIFDGSSKDLGLFPNVDDVWLGELFHKDGTAYRWYCETKDYNYWNSDGVWRGTREKGHDLKVPFRVWGYKDNLYNDE